MNERTKQRVAAAAKLSVRVQVVLEAVTSILCIAGIVTRVTHLARRLATRDEEESTMRRKPDAQELATTWQE